MEKPVINRQIEKEQTAWLTPGTFDFYEAHRKTPGDLYPSERIFLPDLLPKVKTVLDVGCALGGFYPIMKSFNRAVHYTGVDINADFVARARKQYPDAAFEVSDGVHFPFPDSSFDLVFCTGLLHLNTHYQDMVKAMWRQTRQYLLCDYRLTWQASMTGTFRVDFDGKNEGAAVLPYNVVNVSELIRLFISLTPMPGAIRGRGYEHAVSPTARVLSHEVMMSFFLLEKCLNKPPIVDIKINE